jgi:fibronectin-binding autotransporter adhesin
MAPTALSSDFPVAAQPRVCGRSPIQRRRWWVLALVSLGAVAAGAWTTPVVAQQTYTWSNGANTNLWGTSGNWVGSPALTFNNQTTVIFDSANVSEANRSNAVSIGAGVKTIRSLTINADYATSNNATFDIRTNDTLSNTSTARNLTFAANAGNASISVAQSTAGTVQVRVGTNTFGNVVLSSNLDIAQNNTFFNATGFQFDSSVTGAGVITKTGAGVVSLIRDNLAWSGGLNINEGPVQIFASGNAMGTGLWTLGGSANNTTLNVGSNANFTNSGGLVVAAGAGARTIANMGLSPGAGVGNPTLSGAITLNKDATFAVTQYTAATHDRLTLSGTAGGAGGIIKTNSGILILSASNNYSGATDIQGGKLYLGGAGRLGSGAVTIASGANLDFATGASQINVVANNISGAGQILQNVASTDTRITGNITSTGGLTINAGNFRIGNDTTTGSYTGDATVASGATLAFARSDAYTHGGTISGAGGVSKVNAGEATLTGDNSYTGNTALFTGALVADNANALGSGTITFSAGGGNTGTIRYTPASAGTDWASRIVNSAAPIRLDTNGNNVNLAGAIASTNTNGLVKSGSGVLTLGGANAYIGATNVDVGGLIINGSLASTGLASVASGARIGGTGSLAGGLSILSGGLFAFNPADPTLDVTGTVTLDNSFSVASLVNTDGTAINWGSVADGTYQLIGTTASSFANISNFGAGNAATIAVGRTAYFTDGSLNLVVVPEPSTFALLGSLAAAGALLARRRLR